MTDRIVFQGQEYDGVEAMPPSVRAAYQAAMSQAARWAPDLLSRQHSAHFLEAHRDARRAAARVLPWLMGVVAIGILAFGAWALWSLTGSTPAQGVAFPIHPAFLALVAVTAVAGIGMAIWIAQDPERARRVLGALARIEGVTARGLQILLAVAAGGVAAGGYWMISRMDASSRSQGGDVYVGVGVVLGLACIVGMYVAIERRLKQ